jgi:hypothetical protein
MSWVKWVRMEMEGEREPERLGPRVKPVTRPREEQVRPEKEEQGSGTVKSQEEKKAEPGMSVKESLMDWSAARSVGANEEKVEWTRESKRRKKV